MTEKKRRQGQQVATPKPLCPKCGEYLIRNYIHKSIDGKQAFIGSGWTCSSATCDYIVKDFVELGESENVEKVKDFAEVCCDQKSLKELKAAFEGEADKTDMKKWNLTDDQWHEALEVAIIAMENNLSADEAIKCIS